MHEEELSMSAGNLKKGVTSYVDCALRNEPQTDFIQRVIFMRFLSQQVY